MKFPKNLFPSHDVSTPLHLKVKDEAICARRRLDFYGLITHTFHVVRLFLDIATVLFPLIALIIFYSKVSYHTYIFAAIMMLVVVAVLTKMRAEKKYVIFALATTRAGTQWQEWDALLEKVQSGGEETSLGGTELSFLRQKDRAIYSEVIQYGRVEKEKVN